MPSHYLFLVVQSVKSLKLTLQHFFLATTTNGVRIWQSFPDCIIMIIEMHNRVAISDEISLIGNLLCNEVLKYQQTFNSNMRYWRFNLLRLLEPSLTRTVFRFPSELELPGLYCIIQNQERLFRAQQKNVKSSFVSLFCWGRIVLIVWMVIDYEDLKVVPSLVFFILP